MSLLSWGNSFGGGVLPQLWLGRGSLDKVSYYVCIEWLAGGMFQAGSLGTLREAMACVEEEERM